MVDQRQENPKYFDKQQKRQMMNVANCIIKDLTAVHRFGIREHMNAKKQSKRNDSRYLMQFS